MPSYVVIGGSRGVGLGIVQDLAANASNVVFVSVRNKAKSTHLNEMVAKSTGNIHVLEADVVDHRALKAAAAEVAKVTGGKLDVLIHNAARMEAANLYRGLTDYEDEDQLDEELIAAFKVNALGAIHSVNAFLPLLRAGTAKKIVIIDTEGGQTEFVWKLRVSGMAAYGATKASEEIIMTKYAALLEPEGFTVVAISPGVVDTSSTAVEKTDPAAMAEFLPKLAKLRNVQLYTPETAAKRILGIIDSATPKDTAKFFSEAEYID